MVADRVDVISRRAGTDEAWLWSSDGKGTFSVSPAATRGRPAARHPRRPAPDGRRQDLHRALHLGADRQGAIGPRAGADRDRREAGRGAAEIADGAALWTKPKVRHLAADYTDFYRSIAGQFDEPALTIHFRAEGRHEYTALAFVPGSRPFDLFDPDRKGRIKLYVKRVFITDEAEILPRYLRFVRGLVDSTDLPLNVSREKIQESPILAAIKKGVTSRVLGDLEKLAEKEPDAYTKIWDTFGAVLKEGLYEDFERRDALLAPGALQDHRRRRYVAEPEGLCRRAQGKPDRDLLLVGDDIDRLAPRRIWKDSARAASRFCCLPTRSTASGSRPAWRSRASRSSR